MHFHESQIPLLNMSLKMPAMYTVSLNFATDFKEKPRAKPFFSLSLFFFFFSMGLFPEVQACF